MKRVKFLLMTAAIAVLMAGVATFTACNKDDDDKNSKDYVNLGLPSGTKWKNFNATGMYTYDEAVSQFGNQLPTKEQWNELKAECQWTWTGSGYKVTGPNGKSIELPAAGSRICDDDYTGGVGSSGFYWSSTPSGSDEAWSIHFSSDEVDMSDYYQCSGNAVRLVTK